MANDLSSRMRLARLMGGGGDSDGIRPVRRTSGTAVSDSAGGKVRVQLSDGDPIEVPTTAAVKSGQTVSLLVSGGVATAVGVAGWGDLIQSQADATKAEVETVKTTYATKSELSATDTELSGKVSDALTTAKSYTDSSITTEVTNRDAAIKAKADSISLEVSKTYTKQETFSAYQTDADGRIATANSNASTAKTTADKAKASIDGLEIGGRNLVLFSDFSGFDPHGVFTLDGDVATATSSAVGNTNNWQCSLTRTSTDYITTVRNKRFTFSMDFWVTEAITYGTKKPFIGAQLWVEYTPDGSTTNKYKYFSWYGDKLFPTAVTSGWVRTSITHTFPDATIVASGFSLYFRDCKGTAKFRHPKLELGNKPTDWTPAPEDIEQTYATSADLKVQADKITAEVAAREKTDSNVTTLSTKVEQNASSIAAVVATADGTATLIRAYEGGALVAKTGANVGALVNASGSFDVVTLTWSNGVPSVAGTLSSFDADSASFLAGLVRIVAGKATLPGNSKVNSITIDAGDGVAAMRGIISRLEATINGVTSSVSAGWEQDFGYGVTAIVGESTTAHLASDKAELRVGDNRMTMTQDGLTVDRLSFSKAPAWTVGRAVEGKCRAVYSVHGGMVFLTVTTDGDWWDIDGWANVGPFLFSDATGDSTTGVPPSLRPGERVYFPAFTNTGDLLKGYVGTDGSIWLYHSGSVVNWSFSVSWPVGGA